MLNHVLTIGQDLFSIKTKKLGRENKIYEENTFKDHAPKISDFYNDGKTDAASISTADENTRPHIACASSMLRPSLPIKPTWK